MRNKSTLAKLLINLVCLFLFVGCQNKNLGYHEVTSVKKASEDAGFSVEVPEELASSVLKTINVYDEGMVEIIYLNLNHHETGRVRKAIGDVELTDFVKEKYDKVEDVEINDITYTMHTTRNVIYLVTWKNDGFSYCMYIPKGKYTTEITDLLEMTK